MPSPVGHALGGIAIGWHASRRQNLRTAAILAAVAIAPDLDLLLSDHRGISHSLGAACAAGVVAWIASRQPRWGLAVALAWGSHVFLDWLSNDTRPPIGVMALWPMTREYYKASIEIFPPVSRRYWESRFWLYNLRALVVEVAILAPVTILILKSFGGRRTRK
ncbi:MAG TPA: metal-dependent hydrolase [Vicinamibacterales bacterium]|nr:metal-dependent hydrolase [Vicinamibacterales bacterium]